MAQFLFDGSSNHLQRGADALYLNGTQFLFVGSPNRLQRGADAICIFMARTSCLMTPRIVYIAELILFVSLWLAVPV
jgi:hypothetical protein